MRLLKDRDMLLECFELATAMGRVKILSQFLSESEKNMIRSHFSYLYPMVNPYLYSNEILEHFINLGLRIRARAKSNDYGGFIAIHDEIVEARRRYLHRSRKNWKRFVDSLHTMLADAVIYSDDVEFIIKVRHSFKLRVSHILSRVWASGRRGLYLELARKYCQPRKTLYTIFMNPLATRTTIDRRRVNE